MSDDDWVLKAECREMDPALFHPARMDHATRAKAMAVCCRCPVKKPCLEEALRLGPSQIQGVWGGTSERDRREIRKERHLDGIGRPRGRPRQSA